jgi:hypothetical protein
LARRIDQHHRPGLLPHGLHQARQHELPDMQGGKGLQHLDHPAQRPAAAGQLRIQRRVAGAYDAKRRLRQLVGAPDLRQLQGGARESPVEGSGVHTAQGKSKEKWKRTRPSKRRLNYWLFIQ